MADYFTKTAVPATNAALSSAQKAYNAAYREVNREKLLANAKAYYVATREKRLAYQAAYNVENIEVIRAYRKANPDISARYRAAHPERVRAYGVAYRKAHRKTRTAYQAAYRKANSDYDHAYRKAYRDANREAIAKRSAVYTRANPDKFSAKAAKRRANQFRATPAWASDFFISEAYHLAKLREQYTGFKWHVDHIVPLKSRLVCGLHVEHNLQVITGANNIAKGNRVWPDMPGEAIG